MGNVTVYCVTTLNALISWALESVLHSDPLYHLGPSLNGEMWFIDHSYTVEHFFSGGEFILHS